MISTTTNGAKSDASLHSPRILCLHGGGVTGEVFRLQARILIQYLTPTFRLVFADAPFSSDAGRGILPVFESFGPFRRWFRWLPEHPPVDAARAVDEIWVQLRTAMQADDARGADGEWVGLLGFSQGARLSASLLFDQQVREEARRRRRTVGRQEGRPGGSGGYEVEGDVQEGEDKSPRASTTWKFGVLLAGSAPLVSLSEYSAGRKGLVSAADIGDGSESEPEDEGPEDAEGHTLRIPTVHVHGLQDDGLDAHRRLLKQYCDPGSATLVEWEGAHRVPIKAADVDKVIEATMNVAKRTGAI